MDLTRRGLIGRAAAATGALVGGSLLAPRMVFAGDAGEAVFEIRVPRGGGPVETRRPFELIGVEGASEGTEVRARGLDGRWGDWLPLHSGHDNASLSDPVWTGPGRAFELRSRRPLHGARVILVDGGYGATASAERYVDAQLPAAAGQPQVIARSAWATAACRPRVPAIFGAVDLAFVHHTVSSNSYRPSQSAAMVRSICLFHKYGNGWNDIGYNFVVDRYGQIFEARAGGIDETIVGAQAGGYNVYSTGVALLGNFTYGGPPRRAFDSLAQLLAWKLAVHGVELPGTVTVTVTRTGAPYSRYRAGARVSLNRLSGHRDADATTCPGAGMYRQLPRLRQRIRNLIGTVSSLGLQTQASAPGSVTVGGMLSAAGLPIAGAAIEVQRRSTTRGPAALGAATTDANGAWSATVPLATNAVLRAVYRGDPERPAGVSPGVIAVVPPQIALTAAVQQGPPGTVIPFTGSVAPVKPRIAIVIAKQQLDGSYATVRTIQLRPENDGTFSRSIGFLEAGQYQVVAHTSADDANALGTSAPVAIAIA
ncbi:MAG TPA: N-acetylmuramoyl-L-alanine amidase [Thermoleophilaceae bacterium]